MYNKSEPDVNYGLWMMIMCKCGVINYNEYTILGGGVLITKEVVHEGQGIYNKSLTFLSIFLCT